MSHDETKEQATPEEIERAREKYCYGSNDDISIDDDAIVSHADGGCFIQAWVWLKDEESDAQRRCNMHEWDHHEEIRIHYKKKGRRYEVVDGELVGNISYYLVYQPGWPKGMRFHYMSDNPDFSCAYDSLNEVGEPFQQWFIDAMNRYSEKNKA